jgi:uncharacterized protein (DUF302 family)
MTNGGDEVVRYGTTGPEAASFGHVRICALPVATVIERLRHSIEAAGLLVLHEIDPQAILGRAGLKIDAARQLLFFHPRLMARLLRADPAALLEVPLKFAVMALADGTVSVRWLDPTGAFGRYGNAALAELGRELAGIFEAIAADALGASTMGDATKG